MAIKTPLVLSSAGEVQQLQSGDSISTGSIANNTILGNNSGSSNSPSALTANQVALLLALSGRDFGAMLLPGNASPFITF